jgi:hypothetical protein
MAKPPSDVAPATQHGTIATALKAKKPPCGGLSEPSWAWREIGAGEGIRTLDPNLGKVVLYP